MRHLMTPVILGLGLSAAAQVPFNFADFDDGFNANNAGGSWYYWDDNTGGGNSRILSGDTAFKPTEFTDSSLAPGQGGTPFAARMEFVYGTAKPTCGAGCTYDPEVGLGSDLRLNGDTVGDLTGATHISFWAKASAPLKGRFSVSTADITDYSFYGSVLDIGTGWKEIKIDLKNPAQFAQPAWATVKTPFNFAKVRGLEFSFSKEVNPALAGGTFYLDGVQIHNWSLPPDPTSTRPRSVRAAPAAPRLLALLPEGGYLVSLPASRLPGRLDAFAADGKSLAAIPFAAGSQTARLPSTSALPVYLRVTPLR